MKEWKSIWVVQYREDFEIYGVFSTEEKVRPYKEDAGFYVEKVPLDRDDEDE